MLTIFIINYLSTLWLVILFQCLVKPPVKDITRPVDLKLHSDVRALDRAEFDHQVPLSHLIQPVFFFSLLLYMFFHIMSCIVTLFFLGLPKYLYFKVLGTILTAEFIIH